nr:RNA-directed DNA polymerase, eukaryota [Tanacetum cinerariifolium]
MHEENVRNVNEANSLNCNMEENQNGQERNSTNKGSKEEISGLVCSGANVFNAVIANASLDVVLLGGSSFTWCHKSATKMSKLDRFDKPIDNRVHIDMNFPKSITIDQQMDLECVVSKEEVKRAVWECGTDKSPEPDGFSFGFYRQFWSSIENDVFAVVSHFFTFGYIPNGYNSCFIALISKVPDANLVKDFRPISLIGSMYKIIAKILTNRLVGVLGDIVNEVQPAFITERQILDGPDKSS